MTLRELNKMDKFRRIRAASRELFASQGFDATTTRQIADRAQVGLTTLFLYASDKRDLLFLACNDDLAELTERAFADVPPDLPLVDQLVVAFRHFFIFYAENRTLSRDLLRELTFFTSGQQSEHFQRTRATTIARIAALVDGAKARGIVDSSQATEAIAEVLFFVFAAQVRRWLGGERITPEAGVQRLRALLNVVDQGLAPG